MDEQNFEGIIAAAIAQAIAAIHADQAAANPPPALGPPPVAPVFSLTPGLTNVADPWDYQTSSGYKVFFQATAAIDTTFDGSQKNLKVFLEALKTKSTTFGWDDLCLNVPDTGGIDRDLLVQYGMLSVENIRAHATTYTGAETRAAQAATQLAVCLKTSISASTTLKLLLRSGEYTINGVENGPCMLKCLISIVTIETRATVSCVRSALKRLPELIQDVGSDITQFNLAVNGHLDTLRSVDETCDDLINGLFEAYQTASDSTFVDYVKQKEILWEEGTLNVNPAALMKLAEDNYKNRIVKRIWNKASKEETDLLALQAETARGVAQLVALQSSILAGETPAKQAMTKDKAASKKNKPDRRNNDGEWAWKHIAPTGNQDKTKTFKDKHYVACPFHGEVQWVLASGHVGGCRNDPNYKGSGTATGSSDKLTPNGDNKSRAKYIKALMNAMDAAGEDDDSQPDEENI